jgi:hypothetical protein
MTETELRKKMCFALRKCGAYIVPYVGSTMGQKGVADIFLAHKDWHGWIEFKGPKTKVRKIQHHFIVEQRKRGVNAVMLRLMDIDEFSLDDTRGVFFWSKGSDILKELCNHDCLRVYEF